jgi:AraC-like DNA-binding protein
VKYLTWIFRSFYSKGVKAYTDAVRLARIKELLGSGISLSETAAGTGFASVKAMHNFFRYQTNMTIREWNGETDKRIIT